MVFTLNAQLDLQKFETGDRHILPAQVKVEDLTFENQYQNIKLIIKKSDLGAIKIFPIRDLELGNFIDVVHINRHK